MKTKLIALLLVVTFKLISQENVKQNNAIESNDKNRVLGLGIKTFNLIAESSESPYLMPGNKIIMTINTHPNIRIQPEFGINKIKRYNEDLKEDLIDLSITYGGGIYGMWKKDRTILYAGLKYTINKNKYDDKISSTTYNPNPPYNPIYTYKKETTLIKTSAIGIVSGGEYLFGKHFSLGAEVGLSRAKSNVDYPSDQNYFPEDFIMYSFLTETNVLVRYYF